AMRLVLRQLDAELRNIFRHDRRSLAKAEDEYRLDAKGVLDLSELRGHVGIFRTIGLVSDDFDPVFRRHRLRFLATRLAEAAGFGQQGYFGNTAFVDIPEYHTRRPSVG